MDKDFATQSIEFSMVLQNEKKKMNDQARKEQARKKLLNSAKSSSPMKLFDTLDRISLTNMSQFEMEEFDGIPELEKNTQAPPTDMKVDKESLYKVQALKDNMLKDPDQPKSRFILNEKAVQAQKVIYDVLDSDPQMEIEIMRAGMRKKVFDKLDML